VNITPQLTVLDFDSDVLSRETVMSFKNFLKLNLPQKIQSDTEANHHSLPEWMANRFPEIINSSIEIMFAEFEQTQLWSLSTPETSTERNGASRTVQHNGPILSPPEENLQESTSSTFARNIGINGAQELPLPYEKLNAASQSILPPLLALHTPAFSPPFPARYSQESCASKNKFDSTIWSEDGLNMLSGQVTPDSFAPSSHANYQLPTNSEVSKCHPPSRIENSYSPVLDCNEPQMDITEDDYQDWLSSLGLTSINQWTCDTVESSLGMDNGKNKSA
jgi:hypothetical protein